MNSGKLPRLESGKTISYFWELRISFLGLKIHKFFDEDLDPGSCQPLGPGSGMVKIGSGINIPDPQHCLEHIRNHEFSKITQIGERQDHIRGVLDEVQKQAAVVRPQEPRQANVGIPGYLPAYTEKSFTRPDS
jgi:hypothetical protein